MFVFSFKASKVKLIGIICICVIAAVLLISLLPAAGSSRNVNKLDESQELEQINVKNEKGRVRYFESLGYGVLEESVSSTSEKLPKDFDAVMEKYNDLQRAQGFDLEKYKGKNVTGYTYKVSSLPDGTKLGGNTYYATLIVYKNKVVAADLCCPDNGKYYPLVPLS